MTTLGVITFPWHQAAGTPGRSRQIEQQLLGPAANQHLLPYFGTSVSSSSVTVDNTSQAGMDKLLAMLIACGVDYISFDYYPDALGYLAPTGGIQCWEGINNGLQLFLASPMRSQIKFTLVLVGDDLGVASPPVPADWPTVQADILSYLVRPEYLKLADGRPLVYMINPAQFVAWMGSSATATAKINALRGAANRAGFPSDGICLADMSSGSLSLTANVATNYDESTASGSTAIPYSTLTTQAMTHWNQWNSDGKNHIPLCTVGFDIRPRVADNVWDTKVGTGRGLGAVETTPHLYVDGTTTLAQDVANHIKSGFDHVHANPTYCGTTDTVHVYALDEFTECGNGLMPCAQHGAADPYLQVVARTLGRQKESHAALKARGMPIVNRPDRARATY